MTLEQAVVLASKHPLRLYESEEVIIKNETYLPTEIKHSADKNNPKEYYVFVTLRTNKKPYKYEYILLDDFLRQIK